MAESRERQVESPDAALRTWVQDALPRAVCFARSLLIDKHHAEDVVHDCVCKLIERKEQYNLAADGMKLLMRSITNRCIDLSRRKQPVAFGSTADADVPTVEPKDHREPRPEVAIETQELRQFLAEQLERLPVRQRAALELKSLDWTLSEIAQALDLSETNTGVLIHRGRKRLAEELKRYFEVE